LYGNGLANMLDKQYYGIAQVGEQNGPSWSKRSRAEDSRVSNNYGTKNTLKGPKNANHWDLNLYRKLCGTQ